MFDTPRILCIGRSPFLLEIRRLVLAKSFNVIAVDSPEMVRELPRELQLDVAVVCHTVSVHDCDDVFAILRERWPETKVIALTASGSPCGSSRPDRTVRGLDGPEALIETIQSLLEYFQG